MIDSLQFLPANLPVYLYNKAQVKFKLERVLVEDLLGRFDDYRRHRALDPPPPVERKSNRLSAICKLDSRAWTG